MDAIYLITFRGQSDWGMGLLHLFRGAVVGADTGGLLYDGTCQEDSNELRFELEVTVPPGSTLVTGAPPQTTEYRFHLTAPIKRAAIDSGTPQLIETPTGPINVIFRRLRDIAEE
jgi:hypothetical protein